MLVRYKANLDVCKCYRLIKTRITFMKMKYILFQRLISSLNIHIRHLVLIILVLQITSCTTKDKAISKNTVNNVLIIPAPVKLLYKRGFFKFDKTTRLLMNLSDPKSKKLGEYLLSELATKTNFKIKIADRFSTSKINSSIEIITEQITTLPLEGFKLVITSDKIRIYATDEYGLLYAINTAVSLLIKISKDNWQAPQLIIEDHPAAKIRGLKISVDSLPYSPETLIKLLQKNRINHLFTNYEWAENTKENYIKIEKNRQLYSTEISSIKGFYRSTSTQDSLIFNITNTNQLSPNSLAILGEAMWSKPSKLNYERLIKRLNSKLIK